MIQVTTTTHHFAGICCVSNMNRTRIPTRGLSPLWIIALFLSFSETVLGIAVTQTRGGIQAALTIFVMSFPPIVSGLFFIVLWRKPYVFYPPTEFSRSVDVKSFVEAMQSTRHPQQVISVSEVAIKSLESRIATLSKSLEGTNDPGQQAALLIRQAVDAVKKSVLRIDSRPLFKEQGRLWEEAFDPTITIRDFLNNLYFAMEPWGLRAFTYGDKWVLKNLDTGETLSSIGTNWARRNGLYEDLRYLPEIGVSGGMTLQVIPL